MIWNLHAKLVLIPGKRLFHSTEALLKRYGLAMGVVFLIFQELSQIQASNFIFQNLTLLLAGAFGSRPELDIKWTAKGCIRCYSPLHHLHQRNRP